MDIEQDAPPPVDGRDVSAAPVSGASKRKAKAKGNAWSGEHTFSVAPEPERIDNLSRLDLIQAVSDAARSNETSELHDAYGRTWHVSPDTVNNHSVILLRSVKARAVAVQTVLTSTFSVSTQPAHDAIDAICAQLP